MENFLSSFEQRPTGQKVMIGVFIAGLLLLLVILSVIATQPKPQPVTHITPTSTVVPQQTSQSTFPTTSTRSNKTYTYRGNHFEVTYSGDIYTASGNKNNGEDNIVLQHKESSNLGKHDISIQIFSLSKVSEQDARFVFESFKYPKTTIQFNGLQASRYNGSIDIGGISIHETAIVFTKNKLSYKFQLTYSSSLEDPAIQKALDQIISTVKIY